MKVKGIHLSWIVVSDIAKAIKFYTETVGLTLQEYNQEHGWAELAGPTGARLGISQYNPHHNVKPGSNAISTITVEDIQKARDELSKKKAQLIGDILEVPNKVKLQTFCDADGNTSQLCQLL